MRPETHPSGPGRNPRPSPDVPTHGEIGALLNAAADPHEWLVVGLLASTGLRAREALALRRRDVHLATGGGARCAKLASHLHVWSRPRHAGAPPSRSVLPISSDFERLYVRDVAMRGESLGDRLDLQVLVGHDPNERPATLLSVWRTLGTLSERAGLLERVAPSGLRSYFGDHLAASGATPQEITERLDTMPEVALVHYLRAQSRLGYSRDSRR